MFPSKHSNFQFKLISRSAYPLRYFSLEHEWAYIIVKTIHWRRTENGACSDKSRIWLTIHTQCYGLVNSMLPNTEMACTIDHFLRLLCILLFMARKGWCCWVFVLLTRSTLRETWWKYGVPCTRHYLLTIFLRLLLRSKNVLPVGKWTPCAISTGFVYHRACWFLLSNITYIFMIVNILLLFASTAVLWSLKRERKKTVQHNMN